MLSNKSIKIPTTTLLCRLDYRTRADHTTMASSSGFNNCERKCMLVLLSLFVFIQLCMLGAMITYVLAYIDNWN